MGSLAYPMSQSTAVPLRGSCFLRYKMNALPSFCLDGLQSLGCSSSHHRGQLRLSPCPSSLLAMIFAEVSFFCGFLEDVEWTQREAM